MRKQFVGLILSIVLPLFAVSMAYANGSVEAGDTKAAVCKGCHGEGGIKPVLPEYPMIGGQHQDYIVAALQQYKTGKRKNALMNGIAGALSPQDILDLAAYFSSQKSELKMKY